MLLESDNEGALILCSADGVVRRHWRQGVAEAHSVQEVAALAALEALLESDSPPQLLLLHLTLPALGAAQGVVRLRRLFPAVRIMVFADRPWNDEGLYLLQHGVHGYFNTYSNPTLLAKAVDLALSGQVLISRELMTALIQNLQARAPERAPEMVDRITAGLTERECEIVRGVCDGLSNKRIANRLEITERTVKSHLSSIFRKTGTRDRLHLAMRMNGHCT